MTKTNDRLDEILSKIKYDHRQFANGDEWNEITGLKEAIEAIEAYIKEKEKEARIDELLYQTKHADPIVVDLIWVKERIDELKKEDCSELTINGKKYRLVE